MDVANYLSELLGEHSEVNVPGLGYFVQVRLNGYYNAEDGAFYPPRHEVHFDQQFMDDDVLLAQHIADKKNISLASSKYFTAKYIDNLKKEALKGDVPLADLGWLYFDQRIRFRSSGALVNDPAFYGYPKIALSKLSGTSIFEQLDNAQRTTRQPSVPVTPVHVFNDEQITRPAAFIPQPEAATPSAAAYVPQPEYITPAGDQEEFVFRGKTFVDREANRRSPWIYVIILLAIIGIAFLGLFCLYKFKPVAFHRMMGDKPAPISLRVLTKHDTLKTAKPAAKPAVKPDTVKKAPAVINDTTDKTEKVVINGPIDTLAQIRFELLGGAFKTANLANTAIKNYKKLGIDARILKHSTGTLFKLTLGTYFTRTEAVDARQAILNTKKISADKISVQPYYPKN